MTIPPANGLCDRDRSCRRPATALALEPPRELLAHHHLDGAVELAGEPRRRLLPDLAHPLVERGRRDLGVALDLALGDPLEPLGLAPLELDQRQLEPGPGVGLGLLDPVGDRRLPGPQPLGDLLDRAAPLDRVRLELVEGLGDRGRRGPLELLAQPDHGLALLVARRAELGRLALDPRLDIGDRLLLALDRGGRAGSRGGAGPARGRRRLPAAARRAVAPRSASVSASASLALRSRSANVARRSSPRRRSSAASCEIVSARSRASVRRISSACAAVSSSTAAWIAARAVGDERVGSRRAAACAPQREPQADRDRDSGGEAGGKDPDGHAGTL